jgi:DNA-binding transcriptional regulator YiaG
MSSPLDLPTFAALELDSRAPNVDAGEIRRCRAFHGWTQEGFAALFNVSRRTIIRWELRGAHFGDPMLEPFDQHARVWGLIQCGEDVQIHR